VSELERLREAHARAQDEAKRAYDVQRELDEIELLKLKIELGDDNIASVDLPYSPGLPTLVAAKAPQGALLKRYRARIKMKDGAIDPMSIAAAAEELVASCRVYPARDEGGDALYRAIGEARPGVYAQLGQAALKLGAGKEADEGKD